MRPRLPSPIRPFDLIPLHVVLAGKRLFTLLGNGGSAGVAVREDWTWVDEWADPDDVGLRRI